MPSAATKQSRIWLPSSVRMGMFCRFGLELDRRPVEATVWLKVVCSRPVPGSTDAGSGSR